MIIAPIVSGRVDDLRRLLVSMNRSAGVVDPANSLIPFEQFESLHFARIVILEDQTLDDIRAYACQPELYPSYVAFLGDFDGSYERFLACLVKRAESGLRAIYSHCENPPTSSDLLAWIKQHSKRSAATYMNWVGRTMQQVREESALRLSLQSYIKQNRNSLALLPLRQVHTTLQNFVCGEQGNGRLVLSPQSPTPIGWEVRNFLHLIGVPLLLLALLPLILIYAPFFAFQLRRRERADPEIAPRIVPEHAEQLAQLEDHDVTNQFSAFGSVKPGRFRLWSLAFFLWAINYTTLHIFNHGRLARVSTIHFARWVSIDNGKRLFFASNYDGSLDSYMDDFINKVAFGLNLVFSNGIGYPTTRWLIFGGAKDEQKFKYYIRRHQLPTEVWYNAHPGLTALDLHRNSLIRTGLENLPQSDLEIQHWLQLL